MVNGFHPTLNPGADQKRPIEALVVVRVNHHDDVQGRNPYETQNHDPNHWEQWYCYGGH